MGPQFSIIIPNYNYGRFVEAALDSVRRQTVQDYEIIVVDDGSTDDSRDIIEAHAPSFDGKLRCISQSNQGPAAARNTGLKLARGQYIAFLDADDYWHDQRLEKHADVLCRNPDVGLCCSDFVIVREDQTTYRHFDTGGRIEGFPYGVPIPAARAFRLLLKANFVGTSAATIRRSCVEAVGAFQPRYRQAEDYDLWLRCAMAANVYVLREALHSYRVHRGSLTRDFLETSEYSRQVIQDIRKAHRSFVAQNGLSRQVGEAIAGFCYEVGNLSFEDGRTGKAFASYFCGLLSDPTFANVARFLAKTGRKSVRMATFGLVSRKRLLKLTARRGGAPAPLE